MSNLFNRLQNVLTLTEYLVSALQDPCLLKQHRRCNERNKCTIQNLDEFKKNHNLDKSNRIQEKILISLSEVIFGLNVVNRF